MDESERYGCQGKVGWCATLLGGRFVGDDTVLFAEREVDIFYLM